LRLSALGLFLRNHSAPVTTGHRGRPPGTPRGPRRLISSLSDVERDSVRHPAFNADFRIYHCFFPDPNGYLLEIQRFDDPAWRADDAGDA
jgi:catechol 2,3-dioxygenase-like lactoylglutathione lyase family enzyme